MKELHGQLGRRLVGKVPVAGGDPGPHRSRVGALVEEARVVVRLQDQEISIGQGVADLGRGPPQIGGHPQLEARVRVPEGRPRGPWHHGQ